MLHEIEGRVISKYHINQMFLYMQPNTDKPMPCRLAGLDDQMDYVEVQFFYPDGGYRDGQHWGEHQAVPCKRLRWYKQPAYTADDLLR